MVSESKHMKGLCLGFWNITAFHLATHTGRFFSSKGLNGYLGLDETGKFNLLYLVFKRSPEVHTRPLDLLDYLYGFLIIDIHQEQNFLPCY